MAVPFHDLCTQHRYVADRVEAAVLEVLRSGTYVLGPRVGALERRVAAVCGCPHGVGVASGTDALRLALTALGIGPGDEVVTTALSFVATASSVLLCGACPVFADVDAETLALDPDSAARAITPRTKAILPVHLYGHPAPMDALCALADRTGIAVVEDCAQALGARIRGRPVGSFGAAGCVSFYPTKNLGGCGDGGMVVTRDETLARRIGSLRAHGLSVPQVATVLGLNSRLDEIQAAILGVKLDFLEAWTRARQRVAARYTALLDGLPLVLPVVRPGAEHVFHQYAVRCPERETLRAHLQARGVASAVYYPVPLHRQPLFARADPAEHRLAVAERAAEEVLCLPISAEMTEAAQDEVARAIRAYFT